MKQIKRAVTAVLLAALCAVNGAAGAKAAEMVGGTVTLGQFTGLQEDGTYTRILPDDGGSAAVIPTYMYGEFYEAMNGIELTSQMDIKQGTLGGGMYIESEKYAYINGNGEVSQYSVFMSSLPMVQYIAADGAAMYETVRGFYDRAAAESGAETVSEWAYSDILAARDRGMLDGELERYDYTTYITREQFAKMLAHAAETAGYALPEGSGGFSDTDSAEIGVLAAAGVIEGVSETEFKPNDGLTREAAAVILMRFAENIQGEEYVAGDRVFSDAADISDWAADSVSRLAGAGIIKGSDGMFCSKQLYTVEEAAAMIVRMI